MPNITFNHIVNYLENLADAHVSINSKYRWNAHEFSGALRNGVALPVMLIDAPETQTGGDATKTLHNNTTAFTVLDKPNTRTGDFNEYEAQNQVLNACQEICFDLETRILHDAEKVKDSKNAKNWLYGLVSKNSFHHFKVGPVFSDGLYGYRCELTITNQVPTLPDITKWSDL